MSTRKTQAPQGALQSDGGAGFELRGTERPGVARRGLMMTRRGVLGAGVGCLVGGIGLTTASLVCAAGDVAPGTKRDPARGVISARDALARQGAGALALVDIRTPGEWRKAGVAAQAHVVTMHQSPAKFLAELDKATGGDRTRAIGIICATGGRTAYLRPLLLQAGYDRVFDISEGMMGSRRGPGWIAQSMPMRFLSPGAATR